MKKTAKRISTLTSDRIKLLKAKRRYKKSTLYQQPDTFLLYRIIGNDLYPRHEKGQSRKNLKFILENESTFEGVHKKFLINRIVDKGEERKIVALLERFNQDYQIIPFVSAELNEIDIDVAFLPSNSYLFSDEYENLSEKQKILIKTASYRYLNNYVMNNNGARNHALNEGKVTTKWVMPWDGNCFLTEGAWAEIKKVILAKQYCEYFIVPMARITNNKVLLNKDYRPQASEEPQIVFRSDSSEVFNENYSYGRRPKVELLWRLGVPGVWDGWTDYFWDQKRIQPTRVEFKFASAGWVARLFSGVVSLETSSTNTLVDRGSARNQSIIAMLQHVMHQQSTEEALVQYTDALFDNEKLNSTIAPSIIRDARNALKVPSEYYSVVSKKIPPPSGDIHDYFHPAPYWWPNQNTQDGLPYVWRDGERVPGTKLGDHDSDNYDRTRVQEFFDNSLTLAFAWRLTGDTKYTNKACDMMNTFFVKSTTRMNPHLKFAQVIVGKNGNESVGRGIIEFKDIHYYLDAIRLMERSGSMSKLLRSRFRTWLGEYLEWLQTSRQGKIERQSTNNHATYYDLQVLAIADYLNNIDIAYDTLIRLKSRLLQQFDEYGVQHDEISRTKSLHYCVFNLQAWVALERIAERYNIKLISDRDNRIMKSVNHILLSKRDGWKYEQIDEFDENRLYPLLFRVAGYYTKPDALATLYPIDAINITAKFSPHDAILPYWQYSLDKTSF